LTRRHYGFGTAGPLYQIRFSERKANAEHHGWGPISFQTQPEMKLEPRKITPIGRRDVQRLLFVFLQEKLPPWLPKNILPERHEVNVDHMRSFQLVATH
jgi:hypothetical protein